MADREWDWVASVNSRDVVHRDEAEEKIARYREALEFIRRHAELDLAERGVREAERYLLLAREALDA